MSTKSYDEDETELAASIKNEKKSKSSKKSSSDDEEVLEDADEGEYAEEEEEVAEEDTPMEEEAEEAPAGEEEEEGEQEERKERSPRKKKPAAAESTGDKLSFLTTEEDDDDEKHWSTERDEAKEAEAVESHLKKKRRLTKLSDAPAGPVQLRGEKDDLDDFIVDDLGDGGEDDDFGVKRDKKLMDLIQVQKAFQPSSTYQEKGARKRFLCWNSIGSISATEVDSQNNLDLKIHTIEMIYNDSTKLKASKFRDFYNFKVAALGPHGAIFASAKSWDKQEKKEIPSTIFFRPSDTWDNQSTAEWTLPLDISQKEEAELVAIGESWVAVATNKQYVRYISHSSIQKFVQCINGPIVSMVGYDSLCAIVYHDGIPLPGHQNLGLIIMDVDKKKEIYRGKCIISPRSKLTWIGFSDKGMFLSMDSYGVIRALAKAWNWQWTPILDTNYLKKPTSSEVYWPVSLLEDKLMCIILKGGVRQPFVTPRPVPQVISMQLPFLDITNVNGVAFGEENHTRNELLWYNDAYGGMDTASRFFTSKQETTQDKIFLSLFQKACVADRNSKALDLCTELYKKKAVEIAAQIATTQKKANLVARINMLLQVKFPAPKATPTAAASANGRKTIHFDDDEGLSSFLDAPAAPVSKRGTLRRPATIEDAELENARGNEDDEAEYGATQEKKSSLKRKFDETNSSPIKSTPLSTSGSLMSRPIKSANQTAAKPINPHANKK